MTAVLSVCLQQFPSCLLLLRGLPHLCVSDRVTGEPHLVSELCVNSSSYLFGLISCCSPDESSLDSVRLVSASFLPSMGPRSSLEHPAWSVLAPPAQTLLSRLASVEFHALTSLLSLFFIHFSSESVCNIL